MEKRATDTLARYIIVASGLALLYFLAKSIGSVLAYILAAAVVALIGRPLSTLIGKIRLRGRGLPAWLNATLTIIAVLGVVTGVIMLVAPVFTLIASDLSKANLSSISSPFIAINEYLRMTFPSLGTDFKLETVLLGQIKSFFDLSKFSSVISGVASFVASVGIGIFSVVFISFFFIKDPNLFSNMIAALVPDNLEEKTRESITEIEGLISRYASGIFLEVLGVTAINFLGLLIIGRMGFEYSIGIAFMAGLLNVIPYLGPLLGEVLGTLLAITARYACGGAVGLDVNVLVFALIIFAIMFATQLVDNFFFQPFIYSSSIKAHPLEIFIVLLIAGHFGGMLGMFVAIPAYTVLRVIASRFFGHVKLVRRLTGSE